MFCDNVCSSISPTEFQQSMQTACSAVKPNSEIGTMLGCGDNHGCGNKYSCTSMCEKMGTVLKGTNNEKMKKMTDEFCKNEILKKEELKMVKQFCKRMDKKKSNYEAMCDKVKYIDTDCVGYVNAAIAAYHSTS